MPAPLVPADCPGLRFPLKPGALIRQLGVGCGRGMSLVALMHFIVAGPEMGAVPGCWPVLSTVALIVATAFLAPVSASLGINRISDANDDHRSYYGQNCFVHDCRPLP